MIESQLAGHAAKPPDEKEVLIINTISSAHVLNANG
jgi:hypothetical protein